MPARTRLLATLWAALLAAVAAWLLVARAPLSQRVDADLMALLPSAARDPDMRAAMATLARAAERQLVVVVGHADPAQAAAAVRELAAGFRALPLRASNANLDLATLVDFYRPYSSALLTPADRSELASGDAGHWSRRGMRLAYAPWSIGVLSWAEDPFGLFGNWLATLATGTRVRPLGDGLGVVAGDRTYVVLPYEIDTGAFALDVPRRISAGLDAAIAGVHARHADVEILRAGVVLHSAAAANAAESEVAAIGIGSTAGVLLMVVLVFGRLRPVLLIAVSLAMGALVALATTLGVFGHVHVLTLVFGTSLIGVAVDYGLLALGASVGATADVATRYRQLLPGMVVAVVTAVLGYLSMTITSFPGLAQMAVFASSGIIAAWITVMVWFPPLAPASIAPTRLARWLLRLPERWPRLAWRHLPWFAGAALLCLPGWWRVQADDNVRSLMQSDATLVREQRRVSELLGLPSPAQFYIVGGQDAGAVLERIEGLEARLDGLVARGAIAGYDSLARWVPSPRRQAGDRALVAGRLLAGGAALDQVAAATGMESRQVAALRSAGGSLELPRWLDSPVALTARHLWLGCTARHCASIVMLRGLEDRGVVPQLAALAGGEVRWVDRPVEISALLERYRLRLSLLLACGLAVAAGVLWLRYRRDTWRVLLPILLSAALVLAALGALGSPVSLMTLVSLMLLLGMGVDYGVFLQERPGDARMFLAITLAAMATVLSFGLLAFSHTPPLHAFGLATLLGVGGCWALVPLFRRAAPPAAPPPASERGR